MSDARTHGRTHGHKGDFILCPMLCIALDRVGHWTDRQNAAGSKVVVVVVVVYKVTVQ